MVHIEDLNKLVDEELAGRMLKSSKIKRRRQVQDGKKGDA